PPPPPPLPRRLRCRGPIEGRVDLHRVEVLRQIAQRIEALRLRGGVHLPRPIRVIPAGWPESDPAGVRGTGHPRMLPRHVLKRRTSAPPAGGAEKLWTLQAAGTVAGCP